MFDFTSLKLNRVGSIIFDAEPLQLRFEVCAERLIAFLVSCAGKRTAGCVWKREHTLACDLDWMHASG